jgi:hypothetical protein
MHVTAGIACNASSRLQPKHTELDKFQVLQEYSERMVELVSPPPCPIPFFGPARNTTCQTPPQAHFATVVSLHLHLWLDKTNVPELGRIFNKEGAACSERRAFDPTHRNSHLGACVQRAASLYGVGRNRLAIPFKPQEYSGGLLQRTCLPSMDEAYATMRIPTFICRRSETGRNW